MKYLFKNIGLFAISQFSSKILVFLLLPLYTSILTTEEYGTYDILTTTVSLLIPLLTANIAEAVLRFSMDASADKHNVLCVGCTVGIKGVLIFFALISLNHFIKLIPILDIYSQYLLAMFVANITYEMLVNYARGTDDVFAAAVAGIISTFVTVGLNILFLVIFRLGLIGYFCAAIMGTVVATGFLVIRLKIWRYLHIGVGYRAPLRGKMISYSLPMVLNSVSWWLNSYSDRYVIMLFCGVAANGVYSVAYKIPGVLNVFQEIFNKAWILSSVGEFDSNDRSGFFSKIYGYYNCLMTIVCAVIITFTPLLSRFLFAKEFFEAWKYVPLLTISAVFGALSGYLGGIFTATKDTKTLGITTFVGATINLTVDLILVRYIGPMGAAIATVVAYFSVWLMRLALVKKHMRLKVFIGRDMLAYSLLIVQTCLLLNVSAEGQCFFLLSLITILMVCMFCKEIRLMLGDLLPKICNKCSQG